MKYQRWEFPHQNTDFFGVILFRNVVVDKHDDAPFNLSSIFNFNSGGVFNDISFGRLLNDIFSGRV